MTAVTGSSQLDQGRLDMQRQRQREIAEMVTTEGTLKIAGISAHFGVSAMTIRRDLDVLEAQNVLRRTRGHATALASSLYEASTFFRQTQSIESKSSLAHSALELINPGSSVMLDDSTTGVYLARLLHQRAPLTVVTNFLSVANELLKEPGITLNILGGQYHRWCNAMLGGTTVDAIRELRVDTLVMSTSAIIDHTCFHHTQETHLIKRAMFESAARRVLYVDHTKFERRALIGLAPLTDFDAVIVDDLTPAEHIDYLRDHGTRVLVSRRTTTEREPQKADRDQPLKQLPVGVEDTNTDSSSSPPILPSAAPSPDGARSPAISLHPFGAGDPTPSCRPKPDHPRSTS